jgi:hypothetical protein
LERKSQSAKRIPDRKSGKRVYTGRVPVPILPNDEGGAAEKENRFQMVQSERRKIWKSKK